MAMTAIGQVRFGALAGAPDLPQGYHFEAMRDTPNGVRVDVHYKGARIFEMAIVLFYSPEYDDPTGTRYAARVVHDNHPTKRKFNHPHPWIEYPDLPTLMQAMLARHRIGANT
jgi:hypothetical protein